MRGLNAVLEYAGFERAGLEIPKNQEPQSVITESGAFDFEEGIA
jgi:hypothetical protein